EFVARLPRYKALGEPCPVGPMYYVVQHASVLSCNSNYFWYKHQWDCLMVVPKNVCQVVIVVDVVSLI
ncbi:hypothetical protein, partial [Dickeya oryzae]